MVVSDVPMLIRVQNYAFGSVFPVWLFVFNGGYPSSFCNGPWSIKVTHFTHAYQLKSARFCERSCPMHFLTSFQAGSTGRHIVTIRYCIPRANLKNVTT